MILSGMVCLFFFFVNFFYECVIANASSVKILIFVSLICNVDNKESMT